jgi:hypothetical protein
MIDDAQPKDGDNGDKPAEREAALDRAFGGPAEPEPDHGEDSDRLG